MPIQKRTALQDRVMRELVETRAIDFEAIGSLFGKYGAQAALEGDALVSIVNGNAIWNCGWPGPEILSLDAVRDMQR